MHLDARAPAPAHGEPRRELRVDVNSAAYKDSLEQYVELQERPKPAQLRQSVPGRLGPRSQPPVNQPPFEALAEDRFADQAWQPAPERSVSHARDSGALRRPQPHRQDLDRSDEQSAFMRQAINSNILLKRDADVFFGTEKETAASFVRNYHEFYRGYPHLTSSTPNPDLSRRLSKLDAGQARPPQVKPKKKDIYVYNFIEHRPKYLYSTEEHRLRRSEKHYDEFANKAGFKKDTKNFFGVEEEFPKPDFNKRGPVEREEQVSSMNRVYGGKIPLHL